ncbi:MAG TPA: hypothetical protein PK022_03765, partial [Syntrophales bacterium]|nr:hypothetical protein [Syntrophales bacterium]
MTTEYRNVAVMAGSGFLCYLAAVVGVNGDALAARFAQIARKGVVRSFQISSTFPHMSVLENVRVSLQQKLGTAFNFWTSER